MNAFLATFTQGAKNGLAITFEMVKVIVPFYIAIEYLKHTPFLGFVSEIFRPLMGFFGLPGEAALGLMAGYFVNLYAAIAVLVPLSLPAKEITVIALMLGIAHNLPLETAVTRQTGVNAWLMLFARILFSLLSGAILNLLWISFS